MINNVSIEELKSQLSDQIDLMANALKRGEHLELSVSRTARIKIYGAKKRLLNGDLPDSKRG